MMGFRKMDILPSEHRIIGAETQDPFGKYVSEFC